MNILQFGRGVAMVLIHLSGVEYNLNYILTLLCVINAC